MDKQTSNPSVLTKPIVFSFNETTFEQKVKKLEAARDAVAGKPNYNPFLWFNSNVQPFVDLYKKGVRTEVLYKSLMAVSETVPSIK